MEYKVSSILSLISHIHTSTQDFTNKLLSGSTKMVSSHGFILYQLSLEPYLTMGQIAERINRDKSTTTVLIRKLKEQSLVAEKPCSKDSRIKYIYLTDKGKEYNTMTSSISKDLLSVCFTDFTEREKEELLELLVKMQKNIDNSLK